LAAALQTSLQGGQDAFVSKLNPSSATLTYSTYLGGTGGTGTPEIAFAIDVDSSGNAYVAGMTSSQDFPLQRPLQSAARGTLDGFISKLSSAGSALVYSTYLGGSSIDLATAVRVDKSGSACVAGYSASPDFQSAAALQTGNAGSYDSFLSCLTAAGDGLWFSTLLGGTDSDAANGLALAGQSIYVAGQTGSQNFPLKNAVQSRNEGGLGGFVAAIGSNAAPDFALAASADMRTISAGSSAGYSLSVSSLNGFTGPVSFNVSGAPEGATVSFSPPVLYGSGTPVMTIDAPATVAPGTYLVTVLASSGAIAH
jgi:hypothetical protein